MADSETAIANLALLKIGDTGGLLGALSDDTPEGDALTLLYPEKRDQLLRAFPWPWAQRRAYPAQLGGSTYSAATTYAQGDYSSFAPADANVVNSPESISTFVYVSLQGGNKNHSPDTSPTFWKQISRAAWAYAFILPGDVLLPHGLYHSGLRNPREDQHISYELGYEMGADPNGTPVGPGALLFTDAGFPWEIGWSVGAPTVPVSVELQYTARITDPAQFPPDFTETLAWDLAEELCLALRKDASEAGRCATAGRLARGEAIAAAKLSVRPDPEPLPSFIAARATRRYRGRW